MVQIFWTKPCSASLQTTWKSQYSSSATPEREPGWTAVSSPTLAWRVEVQLLGGAKHTAMTGRTQKCGFWIFASKIDLYEASEERLCALPCWNNMILGNATDMQGNSHSLWFGPPTLWDVHHCVGFRHYVLSYLFQDRFYLESKYRYIDRIYRPYCFSLSLKIVIQGLDDGWMNDEWKNESSFTLWGSPLFFWSPSH